MSCGAQQIIACGPNSTETIDEGNTGVWRPSKKRRLVQRRKEAELFGVAERVEDLGPGPDGERRRRRAKLTEKRKETLEQKLKRKLGHPSLKPWDRATLAETYPSSSEDETCGWIPPGEYMRSLFDLPENFTRDATSKDEEEEKVALPKSKTKPSEES